MGTKTSGTNTSGTARQARFVFDRRDWWTFDRSDYLATKIVLGLWVAGAAAFGLGGFVYDTVTKAPLPVSYTAKIPSGMVLPDGATHDGEATMRLLLKDPTFGERLGQAIPGMLLATMTIAIAWLLFQLLRSTQAGDPFTRGNVRRINATALIVGAGGMLVQIAQGFADSNIFGMGRLPQPSTLTVFAGTVTPLPLVVMLVIALIGEAFRRGVVLGDDVEGLV